MPEEVSITVGNKTDKKPLNPGPSGKIKVQFVPGEAVIESARPSLEDAVARSNGVDDQRRKMLVNDLPNEVGERRNRFY